MRSGSFSTIATAVLPTRSASKVGHYNQSVYLRLLTYLVYICGDVRELLPCDVVEHKRR